MWFLVFLAIFGVYACGHQSKSSKSAVDQSARQPHSYSEKLDQVLLLDSNFLPAYREKLFLQLYRKEYDSALKTAYIIDRLEPGIPDYNLLIGLIYDTKGDRILSKKYVAKTLQLYNEILDTLDATTERYDNILMKKAVTLVLIGQESEGNQILNQIYHRRQNTELKEKVSLYLNKTRSEMIDRLLRRN
jgi:hypothetical protein